MHDPSLFITNVQIIIGQRDMKIGDFERSVGLRPGFLSRWAGKEESSPKLDVACRIADALGESLSDLVQKDYFSVLMEEKLKKELRQKEDEVSALKRKLQGIADRRAMKSIPKEDIEAWVERMTDELQT